MRIPKFGKTSVQKFIYVYAYDIWDRGLQHVLTMVKIWCIALTLVGVTSPKVCFSREISELAQPIDMKLCRAIGNKCCFKN